MKKFAILSNNYVSRSDLLAEHGLSIYIVYDDCRILYDAGQMDIFLKNAAFMNIDPAAVDWVVISHNHYDHTGGLKCINNPSATLFIPENLGKPCFKYNKDYFKNISSSYSYAELENQFKSISTVTSKLSINENVFLFSIRSVPGTNDFKEVYYCDANITSPLSHFDELFLVAGNTLFTGCTHCGVRTAVTAAKSLRPEIDSVVGGFHTSSVSEKELHTIAEFLLENKIRNLIPLHCSGLEIASIMKQHSISAVYAGVGNLFDI